MLKRMSLGSKNVWLLRETVLRLCTGEKVFTVMTQLL